MLFPPPPRQEAGGLGNGEPAHCQEELPHPIGLETYTGLESPVELSEEGEAATQQHDSARLPHADARQSFREAWLLPGS